MNALHLWFGFGYEWLSAKIIYLSLGSQLVKTVRSLLSLILSQGISSSSADKDMAFTLSSKLNTLEDRQKHLNEELNSTVQSRYNFVRVLSIFSHICLKEQVQQHPLGADLSKMQRLVQPVPESNELWDFLKRSVLIRLDDIL